MRLFLFIIYIYKDYFYFSILSVSGNITNYPWNLFSIQYGIEPARGDNDKLLQICLFGKRFIWEIKKGK